MENKENRKTVFFSKKAIYANFAYNNSKIREICEAYKNPSIYKIRAYSDIWYEMHRLGGHDLRITGANCNFFSCAYVLGDKLIYHTYANRYEFPRIEEA